MSERFRFSELKSVCDSQLVGTLASLFLRVFDSIQFCQCIKIHVKCWRLYYVFMFFWSDICLCHRHAHKSQDRLLPVLSSLEKNLSKSHMIRFNQTGILFLYAWNSCHESHKFTKCRTQKRPDLIREFIFAYHLSFNYWVNKYRLFAFTLINYKIK